MIDSDTESRSLAQKKRQVDLEYYRFCREEKKPYFGRIMWASQGLPLRHVVMQELVRLESARFGSKPFHILEVGSWAGGSAISWAEAVTRYHKGNGRIICVDPWKPYFDITNRPDALVYREMSNALAEDTIYSLFLHNIMTSGHEGIVLPLRGQSAAMLPSLPGEFFDLAFVDGDHSYDAVLTDLRAVARLVKDGGILCGDDLELQLFEIDQAYARTQIHADYIRDPKSGKEYHPGVTLGVGEFIGPVSSVVGFWAVRKRGEQWEQLDMSQVACSVDRIPVHLTRLEPADDPAFLAWRQRQATSRVMVTVAASTPTAQIVERDKLPLRHRSTMNSTRKPRALLIQLEFSTWNQARAWAYPACFGVAEGLHANGATCTTIPIMANAPFSAESWLAHAKQSVVGQQFDQVWVWLVHSPLDPSILEWITGLAPIRVGIIMESLAYEEQDYAWASHLRARQSLVETQLRTFTHALLPDECDVHNLHGRTSVQALWWPTMVPARFIGSPDKPPIHRQGVFHGEPYGPRRWWVTHEALQNHLTFVRPASPHTYMQRLFDQLQTTVSKKLAGQILMTYEQMKEYSGTLQEIREGEFKEWMAQLPQWAAIVNLPSLAKFFGGRVYEGIAAGRPVLSHRVPDHPLNNALFTEGEEILFFPPDDPESLKDLLDRVIRDAAFAAAIARNAQRKLRAFHTTEHRLAQTLAWIDSGQQPDYGVGASSGDAVGIKRPVVAEDRSQSGVSSDSLRPVPGSPQRDSASSRTPFNFEHVQPGVPTMLSPSERPHSGLSAGSPSETNNFYTNLFVKSSYWSTPHPNSDEAARWTKIAAFLEYLLRRVRQLEPERKLRMLDVGCGRGWLTNLATMYGSCEGIEPVAEVIDHARRLFPHLRFEAGTAQSVLHRLDFVPYDVVLCSEVIEHVPHGQKESFVAELASLLKSDGFLILTTPRGEMWEQWKAIAPPNQPVEDWVTEEQLRGLFSGQGFYELGLERVHVEIPTLRYIPAPTPADHRTLKLIPIYQVWACQRDQGISALSFTRPPMVSVIVPTCNRPDRLKEALASVLAQTYQDFEVIVVNDGTAEVDSVISSVNSGHRIASITHDRNRGLAAARNTGIRAAKGKYIAYLDDDDRYLPDHLETLVSFLEHNDHKVAYTDAWRVHERIENGHNVETGRDLPYSHDFNSANLLVSNFLPVLCIMHERSCIDEVGTFDEALFAHEDWDLWIRMASRFPFRHLKRVTGEFTWRTDGSSMTSASRDTYWRTMEIIYRKYRPYAERIPEVLQAQQQALTTMRGSILPQAFDCSIIIPVWNKRELTEQCLSELARVTSGISYEVIVVDNHSTDDTAQFLNQLSGDIQIIRNSENLGFAKACNQGAQAARGRFLIFLNNDTIPLSNWLTALVAEATSHPEVGIVGSKLLYEDDTIQHAGVVFSRAGLMPYHLYRHFHRDHPAVNQRRTFQSVTAACMLIRREIFETAGGFDEGFQNGFEDVDLCLKVCDKGWQIVYQPLSMLYHLESQTPGRKTHDQANALRFLKRWGQRWWVADEDIYYDEDGYECVHTKDGDQEQLELRPIQHDEERASWKLVVDTERAALRQDIPLVESLLARWDEWPSVADVLVWGAWLCTRTGHSPLSRHFYQKLLRHHDDPTARKALARMALEDGNLQEVDSHLGILLKRFPRDGEGWVLRGILGMQQTQFAEAEQAFLTALAHQGDRRKCMMGLGMARTGLDESEQAWNDFCTVLNEYPDDAEAIHWLLRAGSVCGSWAELSKRLQVFVSRNPADLSVRYALAGVLIRGGRIDAAQQEYQTLCTLDPSYEGLKELAQALSTENTLAEIVPQS